MARRTRMPDAIEQVALLDPQLARRLEKDFDRLLIAGEALHWAHELLPQFLATCGPAACLQLLLSTGKRLAQVPSGWAVTWTGEPDNGDVSYSAVAASGADIPDPSTMSSTVVYEVIQTGRPSWSDDAASDARFASSQSVQSFGLRSVACIPIGTRGALYLHDATEPGRFDPVTRARLTVLCTLGAHFVHQEVPAPDESLEGLPGLVGRSTGMTELARTAHAFAAMPWPVLILGETGTGKEGVARAVHTLSQVSDGEFVAVNCGAIPSELAESLLFGHERGAFTGANTSREGLLHRAQGGTLFLDEVGELEPRLQVKLLRLLQENTFEKVGGTRALRFRGRVVAATHRPLDRHLGGFREDLYYRLAACVLRVPPLRDRMEDVPALAEHLVARALEALPGQPQIELGPRALTWLQSRSWPGNVRELENLLRGAIALCIASGETTLQPTHFPLQMGAPPEQESLMEATARFQQQKVRTALALCDGNRSQAAKRLGVSRQWLHRLLQRWESDE